MDSPIWNNYALIGRRFASVESFVGIVSALMAVKLISSTSRKRALCIASDWVRGTASQLPASSAGSGRIFRCPRIVLIACETGDTAHRSKALYGTAFNDHPRSSTARTLSHTTAASSNPIRTEDRSLFPADNRTAYQLSFLTKDIQNPSFRCRTPARHIHDVSLAD